MHKRKKNPGKLTEKDWLQKVKGETRECYPTIQERALKEDGIGQEHQLLQGGQNKRMKSWPFKFRKLGFIEMILPEQFQ